MGDFIDVYFRTLVLHSRGNLWLLRACGALRCRAAIVSRKPPSRTVRDLTAKASDDSKFEFAMQQVDCPIPANKTIAGTVESP